MEKLNKGLLLKSLKAFKELVVMYTKVIDDNDVTDEMLEDYGGRYILSDKTKFGTKSCTLCAAINANKDRFAINDCTNCLYTNFGVEKKIGADSLSHYCLNESYYAIENAETAKELYAAIAVRIVNLKGIIAKTEDYLMLAVKV